MTTENQVIIEQQIKNVLKSCIMEVSIEPDMDDNNQVCISYGHDNHLLLELWINESPTLYCDLKFQDLCNFSDFDFHIDFEYCLKNVITKMFCLNSMDIDSGRDMF